jgi:hypothetical protein
MDFIKILSHEQLRKLTYRYETWWSKTYFLSISFIKTTVTTCVIKVQSSHFHTPHHCHVCIIINACAPRLIWNKTIATKISWLAINTMSLAFTMRFVNVTGAVRQRTKLSALRFLERSFSRKWNHVLGIKCHRAELNAHWASVHWCSHRQVQQLCVKS